MIYLTKSRFKLGLECPTKLYYHNHPDVYANNSLDDAFLQALADGGFQVGELAKKYYPSPYEIKTRNHRQAADETEQLMQKDSVIIHEASFLADEKLFIKGDILEKIGNRINLIEVKAKSINRTTDDFLTKKNKTVASDWKQYVYDLAFQYYVVKKLYPAHDLHAYLLLADKESKATIDGLHQMFKVERNGKETKTTCTDLPKEALGEEILCLCPLTEIVEKLVNSTNFDDRGKSFTAVVDQLANICVNDEIEYQEPGKHCKGCEYVRNESQPDLKEGCIECWQRAFPGLSVEDLKMPKYFDIWYYRGKLPKEKFFMHQVVQEDIAGDTDVIDDNGMSMAFRQWTQVASSQNGSTEPVMLLDELREKLSGYIYPFHFIDFETIRAAIPFHKGHRPYEQIAFQFSHHIMEKDGSVVHANEWINDVQGRFPNFEFVRALKKALEADNGTIFRYAHHENSVLNEIRDKLQYSTEPDKEELITFILSITQQKADKVTIQGERNMQDICDLVRKYYYHPLMGGSNSIKKVLPAILNQSKFLKEKYKLPVYGSELMPSKNFSNMIWISEENGMVKDPYTLLEKFYDPATDERLNEEEEVSVREGGAAMVAYAEMQFSSMTAAQMENRIKALKKYCELDTLAMVMIMEEFLDITGLRKEKSKMAIVA